MYKHKLLSKHINFVVENMSFRALQKRAVKTERQEQATEILQKDGTTKKVYTPSLKFFGLIS